MKTTEHVITVDIYDHEYTLKCDIDEVQSLRHAAKQLDRMMRNISSAQNVISIDKIAIMTALTITHEHLQQRKDTSSEIQSVNLRIKKLLHKIQNSLTLQEELEV